MTDKKSVALIIIGDEILRGQIQESNLRYLANSLSFVGFKIAKVEILPDNIEEIARSINELSLKYPIVFTCGGVGPTHDDVTYKGVTKGLGLRLEENRNLLDFLKQKFPEQPGALRLALVPDPCEIIYICKDNVEEKYAIIKTKNVYILPGSPKFFTRAVDEIVPKLQGGCRSYFDSVNLKKDEFSIVDILDDHVKKWKTLVDIGSYPQYLQNGESTTQVTFEGEIENVASCKQELLRHLSSFTLKDANRIYETANESPHVKKALDIIEKCYELYSNEEVFVSFNGGKDCTAVLHLAAAVALKKNFGPLIALYVIDDSFPEVDVFVEQATSHYGLILVKKIAGIQEALDRILTDKPKLRASLIGSRKDDPSPPREYFSPTDSNWPNIMRVSPILDWSYSDVWNFLLRHRVQYCPLYDQGYTSIGRKSTTMKNLKLKDPNNPTKYFPAHQLRDDTSERQGRE